MCNTHASSFAKLTGTIFLVPVIVFLFLYGACDFLRSNSICVAFSVIYKPLSFETQESKQAFLSILSKQLYDLKYQKDTIVPG